MGSRVEVGGGGGQEGGGGDLGNEDLELILIDLGIEPGREGSNRLAQSP